MVAPIVAAAGIGAAGAIGSALLSRKGGGGGSVPVIPDFLKGPIKDLIEETSDQSQRIRRGPSPAPFASFVDPATTRGLAQLESLSRAFFPVGQNVGRQVEMLLGGGGLVNPFDNNRRGFSPGSLFSRPQAADAGAIRSRIAEPIRPRFNVGQLGGPTLADLGEAFLPKPMPEQLVPQPISIEEQVNEALKNISPKQAEEFRRKALLRETSREAGEGF